MSRRALVIYGHDSDPAPYEEAIRLAGIDPVMTLANESLSLDGLGGLILTGGTDVNPALYGQERQPETEKPDELRDRVELALIADALERDLPLFAICRGLQILNVQHGGTLIQHISSVARHRRRTENRALPAHQVSVEPGTLLSDVAGVPGWPVNSRHHQAVDRVGTGLVVSARDSEDGTVEALERPDRSFVLAVQWHPENQAPVDAGQLRIFQRFAEALRLQ